jgi:methyl-accepting chemotaxis protein
VGFWQNLSIRFKIILTVLLLVAFSLGVMGTLNYRQAAQQISEIMEDRVLMLAEAQSENIDNWLNIRLAEMETLANTPGLQTMDVDSILPRLVDQHNRLKNHYELLYIAKLDGTCYLSSGGTNNVADREYFRQALAGKSIVSDPVISKASGNPIVVAVTPVRNSQGVVIGVLGGVVLIDTINQMVGSVQVGETGYAYLIQQSGLTITHPDKSWVLKVNILKDGGYDQSLVNIITKMTRGETGIDRYLINGGERLLGYAPIDTTGWSLGVVIPSLEIEEGISALLRSSLIVGILCLLLLGAAIFFIVQLTIKPLYGLAEASQKIAQGDLTQTIEVNSKDEIGQLALNFNLMVDNLRRLVNQIGSMTKQVSASTNQLANAANESGKATEQVAVSIGELARGIANEAEVTQDTAKVAIEMTSALQQVETCSKTIENVSQVFNKVVDEGMSVVNDLGTKMQASVKSSEGVEHAIRDLDHMSNKIGEIVEVITSIAGQTNLLALNAAIEAARAGEQGRGFAVVADEVRKLAEGSAQAANQIAKLITDIQKGTQTAVNEVAISLEVIKAQAVAVDVTENLFVNIEKGVGKIQVDIVENKAALTRLVSQVNKISEAVESISAITQQSAASAEEVSAITEEQSASAQMIASSAQEIAALVIELEQAVDKFKL